MHARLRMQGSLVLTPPSSKAERYLSTKLEQAEQLEADGHYDDAAHLKATALQVGLGVYKAQRARKALVDLSNNRSSVSDAAADALVDASVTTADATADADVDDIDAGAPGPLSPGEAVRLPGESLDLRSPVPRSRIAGTAPRPLDSLPFANSREVQSVLVSGACYIDHLPGQAFTLYQLHVPLVDGERFAYRRYSEFLALDQRLAHIAKEPSAMLCLSSRSLPRLPPRTLPWEDRNDPEVILRRWGALQVYLDAALELVSREAQDGKGWELLREFLSL